MLRVRDVAARLNCSLSTVYQLIGIGRIPSHQIGLSRAIRISEEDLQIYLEQSRAVRRRVPAAAPAQSGAPFRHLDGERLRAAWRRQGVLSDRKDADSAPSSVL